MNNKFGLKLGMTRWLIIIWYKCITQPIESGGTTLVDNYAEESFEKKFVVNKEVVWCNFYFRRPLK